MALTMAIYTGNRAMGGVETDWTDVDRALAADAHPVPLLRSITVHGARVLTRDDVLDLRAECDLIIPQASAAARWTLTRLKELTEAALSLPDSELRLVGSG